MPGRTNEQWLNDLQDAGPVREAAISDLRRILITGLERGLLGYVNTSAPEFESLVEDFVQEALLKILNKLDTFAGRSQFTTWAHKIAVATAVSELRRKRWQDFSLDGLADGQNGFALSSVLADSSPAPENVTERADMLVRIQRLIREDLTDKQRTALLAAVVQGRSIAEIATAMDMKPNALYKLLHDARLQLKRRLASEGLTPGDVMSIFE